MNRPRDDRRLLAALARGDLDALGQLYDAYALPVYHLLLARGLDEPVAEDVLQDVFLSLLDRGAAVARIRNVQAYLLQVARNMASRHLHRPPRSVSLGEAKPLEPDPGTGVVAENTAVRDAVRQLPAEQAQVVVLKVWHELTFAEIGEALGISPNTAASRYRYALQKLREIWGEANDE